MASLFDSRVLPFVGGEYRGRVVRDDPDPTDADTVPVLLDLGLEVTVRAQLRVRDLYCAERGTPAGEAALEMGRRLLPDGCMVRVRIHRTKTDREKRTFVRYVADVQLPVAGMWADYAAAMNGAGRGGQGTGSRGGTDG